MKVLISQFLVLLFLMPSLACAKPACSSADQEEARPAKKELVRKKASDTGFSSRPHCADNHEGMDAQKADPVMLLGDCMGEDLQQSPIPFQLDKSVVDELVSYVDGNATFAFDAFYLHIDGARGPPRSGEGVPQPTPIYLAKQRVRI